MKIHENLKDFQIFKTIQIIILLKKKLYIIKLYLNYY